MAGNTRPCAIAVGAVVLIIIIFVAMGRRDGPPPGPKDSFWTQYGGAIPPAEQARRFDAAGKGVPDTPWAEAYWPPIPCGYC